MPRHREFDESVALEKATMTFWEQGYEDTSYDDLVTSTGVSRYGLYSAFGGKKEFFLRALDHYIESSRCEMLGSLMESEASLDDIFQYFYRMEEKIQDPEKRVGCMLCNTAIEMAQNDKDAETKIKNIFDELKKFFIRALNNAIKEGNLAKSSDPDKIGDYLVGLMMGAAMMTRSPIGQVKVKNYLETGLAVLK